MLQNRVDPFGNICETSARGHWTGTRGLLHNEHRIIVRPFKHKAWIACLLEFKGRRRIVMSPGLYTELFFWDEATAFAAGHRPCCECRREDYDRFKLFWLQGNKEHGFDRKTSIKEIDNVIHGERINSKGQKVVHAASILSLPDGSFIQLNERPWLVYQKSIYPWSFSGYGPGENFASGKTVNVLTPLSIINALRAGYVPEIRMQA